MLSRNSLNRPMIIHMVGNAHLDPVWLWTKKIGITEVLLTTKTVLELLHEYPSCVFTCSDAWFYEMLETYEPKLVEKIADFTRSGQWEHVGGWYVQPDCNFPTRESFCQHIAIGQALLSRMFNVKTSVGYNIDSFGHSAALPSILSHYGYKYYVMMRPGAHEKAISSPLFRWQSPTGEELLTWRIVTRYETGTVAALVETVHDVIDLYRTSGLATGHAMCFYGVGDHGGGPSREQIEWIHTHRNYRDAELVFSSPNQFFSAVEPFRSQIPIVSGELQYHAVGCYSLQRNLKTAMRKAEILAVRRQVQNSLVWKKILFNQFHDILAGTSIRDASISAWIDLEQVVSQIEDDDIDRGIHILTLLPASRHQRIIVWNPSVNSFSGVVEHEPWLQWEQFTGDLVDESGCKVLYQLEKQASLSGCKRKLVWYTTVPAKKWRIYHLVPNQGKRIPELSAACKKEPVQEPVQEISQYVTDVWEIEPELESNTIRFSFYERNIRTSCSVCLEVFDDSRDTWGHGVDAFTGKSRHRFVLGPMQLVEKGEVRATMLIPVQHESGNGRIVIRHSFGSGELSFSGNLYWQGKFQILKMIITPDTPILHRFDGISEGVVRREQDCKEYPFQNGTSLSLTDGSRLTVITPDVFSLDGDKDAVRLTILRSPIFSWQDKNYIPHSENALYDFIDQGEVGFSFLFDFRNQFSSDIKESAWNMFDRPVLFDWTRGMC
ncbi:MAG: hypothetical protein K9L21_02710 [Spirochaetia bacterium]|nr:hypothetical protein [Spirochaetia bacterium]